jgi:hypothetical protein
MVVLARTKSPTLNERGPASVLEEFKWPDTHKNQIAAALNAKTSFRKLCATGEKKKNFNKVKNLAS